MNQERTAIGPWLFWSLMMSICLSLGTVNINIYNAETMGANGYLAVFISVLFTLPGLIAIYLLMKRFPNHNLIQQGISIWGGFFGRVAGIIYLLFLLAFFIVYSSDVANLVHNYLLQSTPFYILCGVDLLIAAYLSSRGIETISRIASFVILPLATAICLLFILALPEVRIDRLMPIFHFRFNFKGNGGTSILNVFYPLGFMAMVTPYCKGIHQKIPRMTMIAFSVLISIFLLDSIGTIGIFGHTYISQLAYPSVETFRTVEMAYILIEQAGLLGVISIMAAVIIGSGFTLYIIALGTSQIFGLWDYKRFIWILAPIVFFSKIWLAHPTLVKSLSHLFAKHGWMIIWGYPILLYLCALILKKRGKTSNAS